MTVRIYSLKNPIDNKIFYVGRTVASLSQRVSAHLSEYSDGQKGKIIKEIKNCNLKPIAEELEIIKVSNAEEEMAAFKREDFWIQKYIQEGHVLVNVSGVKNEMKHSLVSTIVRERKKTFPIGVRFDEDKLEFLKKTEGISSNQKVVDFLLDEYWKLFAPREVFQSKFSQPNNQTASTTKNLPTPPQIEMSAYEVYFSELEFAKSVYEIKATMKEVVDDKELDAQQKRSLEKYAHEKAIEFNF